MPTHYLYGTLLTRQAVAANNRGDNIGNTTTLQKVFLQDDLHTSVSAEAIRFALRYRFQLEGLEPNRSWDAEQGKLVYFDEKRAYLGRKDEPLRIDDDLMGFMDAQAAKAEKEDEGADEGEPPEEGAKASTAKSPRAKGKAAKGKGATRRAGPLTVGRAVSLRPYRGETSFNAVSGEKEKGKLSLYGAEIHTTEYQYSFGLHLDGVKNPLHVRHLLEAIADPPPVAGNHARFAYDFSPASIVLRVTHAHSSRIQNCFEHDEASRGYSLERLLRRVESGDVPAEELIVGGELAAHPDGQRLEALKVTVHKGVDAACRAALERVAGFGGRYNELGKR